MEKIDTVDVQTRRHISIRKKGGKQQFLLPSQPDRISESNPCRAKVRKPPETLMPDNSLDVLESSINVSTIRLLRYPVLIVDELLMVSFSNCAAQSLLDAGSLLREKDGLLCASTIRESLELRSTLMEVFEDDTSVENHVSFSLKCVETGQYCMCFAVRLHAATIDGSLPFASALLLIADPARKLTIPFKQLNALFGLTYQESRIALALLNGISIKEFSVDAHISLNTARTHLKAVFQKTFTCSQPSLVALLARLVPPIISGDGDTVR